MSHRSLIETAAAFRQSPARITPQLGQLGVAMLLNQPIHPQPAAALAPGAHDLENCDPAGKVAERDGIVSHGPTGPSSARCTR